jgi:hypothetical protein
LEKNQKGAKMGFFEKVSFSVKMVPFFQSKTTLQKKRVIFFDSNKCNFLKHSKLVKFSQITLLNVNAQNEKVIFCLKIFKFNLKL